MKFHGPPPFVIAGCTNRTVIFDLQFRVEVPQGDPVLGTDPVIGRILRLEGFKRTIAPRQENREVLRRKEDAPEDEDELSNFEEEEDAGHNNARGVRRRVDWTATLEDIAQKGRWDGDPG